MTTLNTLDGFRAEVRSWLATKTLPAVPSDFHGRFEVRRKWQRELYEDGWLGLAWPREDGGRGLTPMHQVVFNQELAMAGAPGPAGTTGIEVIGPTITAQGTVEQKAAILPKILSGEQIWCQGFSEPGSGSDLASLSTSAQRTATGFVINGHKVWNTYALVATHSAVLVRTDREAPVHRGISYLLVNLSAPGVTVRPIAQLNGEQEFGEIFLDNVEVPADAMLGEVNAGWRYTMQTLSSERSNYALRRTTDLVVDLRQVLAEVGGSGAQFTEAELSEIGHLQARLYALEAQCEWAAERMAGAPGKANPFDSFDKMALTTVEQGLLRFIRDCLGRYGNVTGRTPRGLDSDRWVRRYLYSRACSIYGGSAQIQRNIVAERILGLPVERSWEPS